MSVSTRLYTPADAQAFHDLNIAWIETHFVVEEKDRKTLEQPDENIIGIGGRIVIAELDGGVVGTAALIPVSDHKVELAKMCVDETKRGNGIGKAIMARVDSEAADMGANTIWLESNTVLDAAMHLYKICGYRKLTDGECTPSPYDRCNIQMEKTLSRFNLK